jgi:hypothetical protein
MTTPHKHAALLRAAANDVNTRFIYTKKDRQKARGSNIFAVLQFPNRDWSIKPDTPVKTKQVQMLVMVNNRPYRVAKNSTGAKLIVKWLQRRGICATTVPFTSPL